MTTRRDLACRMLPYISPRSAVNRLNIWIKQCPELQEKLRASADYHPGSHYLTPQQVQLIEDYLGI